MCGAQSRRDVDAVCKCCGVSVATTVGSHVLQVGFEMALFPLAAMLSRAISPPNLRRRGSGTASRRHAGATSRVSQDVAPGKYVK